ncbi:MAG: hypothetical protein J0L92_15480 [Deltaproteobacteria bacterium]|nr:hypothetical protein [Deltaproteobacteria bacterium]
MRVATWVVSACSVASVGCGAAAVHRPMDAVSTQIVLQTVGGARLEDALEDTELLSSAHGELVVRDANGVFARRRFGFVTSRAVGRFVGDARHVVVSTMDDGGREGFANPRDPFGMQSNQLVRWDLDTDAITVLGAAPNANPTLCRSGTRVIALDEGRLSLLDVIGRVALEESADELVQRDETCFVRRGSEWLAAVASEGAITTSATAAPQARDVSEGPDTSYAAQIEWISLAPTSDRLVIATRTHAFALSAQGFVQLELPDGRGEWRSDGLVAWGHVMVPIEIETRRAPSFLDERVRSVADADPWDIPEIAAYGAWQTEARAAIEEGRPRPPWPIEPVCSAGEPRSCVRAHLAGTAVDTWEIFDATSPEVVRARLPLTVPPGAGYVHVSPGGRYVRETTSGVAIRATSPDDRSVIVGSGSWTEITTGWAELRSGWVVIDPDDDHVLRALRHEGPARERRFEVPLERVTVVDDGHVFVRVAREGGDEGHVIDAATLETTRVIALGVEGEDRRLRCRDGGLVDANDRPQQGRCPIETLAEADARHVWVSASQAFWLDARRLDEVVVHRTRDGATLTLGVLDGGLVAYTADGAFELEGEISVESLARVERSRDGRARVSPAAQEQHEVVAAFFAAP